MCITKCARFEISRLSGIARVSFLCGGTGRGWISNERAAACFTGGSHRSLCAYGWGPQTRLRVLVGSRAKPLEAFGGL